jgi:DNA transformation protein and related proteins
MAVKSEFVNYLMELLEPFEGVSAKSMFGGFGIFRDSLMFALVAEDTLYIKTDDFNRFEFERLNLGPFMYTKDNKSMPMKYFRVPDEALDSSEELLRWAQLGFEAALRAKKK